MFGKGKTREQRLAEKTRQKSGPVPGDAAAARKALARAARQTRCADLAQQLRDHGWTDVSAAMAAGVYVIAGTDPDGQRHASSGPVGADVIAVLIEQGGTTQEPAEDTAGREAAAGETIIIVAGKTYAVSVEKDGPKISAAFMQVLARKDAEVQLASGEVLPVTAATIDEISNQLAGA